MNDSKGRFKLLIGTKNPGKTQEISRFLQGLEIELVSLRGFSPIKTVNETGNSYAENALLKATAYARQTGMYALADDSGLEVDALKGGPGLLSARYLGTDASDSERIKLLLAELSKTEDAQRTARFRSAIAVVDPLGYLLNIAEGTCEGTIAGEPRGNNGFGYDPIFVPRGDSQTFGELASQEKDRMSHRAKALKITRTFLLQLTSK
jgi:XTP/dITP diphosphohydrolase